MPETNNPSPRNHESTSLTLVNAALLFFFGGSLTVSSPDGAGVSAALELLGVGFDGGSPAELDAYPVPLPPNPNRFSSTLAAGVNGGSAGLFIGTVIGGAAGEMLSDIGTLGREDTGREGVESGVGTVELVSGREWWCAMD